MHPIERLRYVARASGVPQHVLVRETASAMSSFADDHHALVTACRRMVARQPASGGLLWLAARMLTALEPRAEAWAVIDEIESDTAPDTLEEALPDGVTVCAIGWPEIVGATLARRGDVGALIVDSSGDGSSLVHQLQLIGIDAGGIRDDGLGAAVAASELVLLEALAVGPTDALSVSGSRAAAAVACHAGIPVWLVTGVGRVLPNVMWRGLADRVASDEPWEERHEIVPLDLVTEVVRSDRRCSVGEAVQRPDCPVAAELA